MPEIASLPYGYVVGRFLLVQGDTSDDADRFPDAVPARGTVKFTPVAPRHLITTVRPATAIALPITLTISDNGYITDPSGNEGVWVIAGQYDVSFSFNGITHSPFRIAVKAEHTLTAPLDLTLAAPLTVTPDIKFVVNEAVYAQTLRARDEAVAAAAGGSGPTKEAVTAAVEEALDDALAPLVARLAVVEAALASGGGTTPPPASGPVLTADPSDPGTYNITASGVAEDTSEPGTYVVTSGLTHDTSDPGTFLIGT